MAPLPMVVRHELLEHVPQAPFAEQNQAVLSSISYFCRCSWINSRLRYVSNVSALPWWGFGGGVRRRAARHRYDRTRTSR